MQSYISLSLNLKLTWQRLETAKMEEIHKMWPVGHSNSASLGHQGAHEDLQFTRDVKNRARQLPFSLLPRLSHFFRLSPFDFKTLLPSAGAGA